VHLDLARFANVAEPPALKSPGPTTEGHEELVAARQHPPPIYRGRRDQSPTMTRIRTIPLAEADDVLRIAREAQHALYPPEYATPVPPLVDDAGGIVSAHSLIPDALYHAFATFGVLMSPELPLSRRQHEMITTMVSVTNRCRY
jgi:hypothetical protein